MNESSPSEKPRRRPRYAGTHPRHFHQKYKEQRPEDYAAEVAKILSHGKTPAGTHRPILVREILEILALKPGETVVDCTLGYGGHARELLSAVQPGGRLLGLDIDPIEFPKTEARLRSHAAASGFPDEALQLIRSNFAGLANVLSVQAPAGVDAILADLGCSSMQFDNPDRGFSFKTDGPLDMRMNPQRGLPVAERLSRWKIEELQPILADFADEPQAKFLAAEILARHAKSAFQTTGQLATFLRSMSEDSDTAADTIRRVFQALRIAVNEEFSALDAFLRSLPGCLKPGGRVAILSFHSGEDRRVKHAFKHGFQRGLYSAISENVLRPGPEEQHSNPRSSSAKLRYAIRSV